MEEDSYYYYRLGDSSYENGKIEEAIEFFFKSLDLAYHFKTYEKLYHCYSFLQQTSLAHYFIKRAWEENHNNDKTAYLYAKSLIEKNDITKAKKTLLDILARNPNYKKTKDEYQKLLPMKRY